MMELLLLKLIWMGICFFHLKHRTLWLSQSGMHMPGCTVARAFSSEVARLILLTTAVALTLEDDVIISLEQQARLKETRPRPRRPKRKFCRFCDSWDLFVFPDHHMQTTKTADAHLLVCMQLEVCFCAHWFLWALREQDQDAATCLVSVVLRYENRTLCPSGLPRRLGTGSLSVRSQQQSESPLKVPVLWH